MKIATLLVGLSSLLMASCQLQNNTAGNAQPYKLVMQKSVDSLPLYRTDPGTSEFGGPRLGIPVVV